MLGMSYKLGETPSSSAPENGMSDPMQAGLRRLQESHWFEQSSPEDHIWDCVMEARKNLLSRPHDTVYYPGIGADLAYPLALADANVIIATDPSWSYEDGRPNWEDSIAETLQDLGCEAIFFARPTAEGEPLTINFTFGGKKRIARIYADYAEQFTPPEVADGSADVLLLKNTYLNSDTDLHTPENLAGLLRSLRLGGSVVKYLWWDSGGLLEQSGWEQTYSGITRVNVHGDSSDLKVYVSHGDGSSPGRLEPE
jgi:hypothetical protein